MVLTFQEALKDQLRRGDKCLDVGAGSGYLTVAMRLLMTHVKNAFVFGIEHVHELRDIAERNIIEAGFEDDILDYKLFVQKWDGRKGMRR